MQVFKYYFFGFIIASAGQASHLMPIEKYPLIGNYIIQRGLEGSSAEKKLGVYLLDNGVGIGYTDSKRGITSSFGQGIPLYSFNHEYYIPNKDHRKQILDQAIEAAQSLSEGAVQNLRLKDQILVHLLNSSDIGRTYTAMRAMQQSEAVLDGLGIARQAAVAVQLFFRTQQANLPFAHDRIFKEAIQLFDDLYSSAARISLKEGNGTYITTDRQGNLLVANAEQQKNLASSNGTAVPKALSSIPSKFLEANNQTQEESLTEDAKNSHKLKFADFVGTVMEAFKFFNNIIEDRVSNGFSDDEGIAYLQLDLNDEFSKTNQPRFSKTQDSIATLLGFLQIKSKDLQLLFLAYFSSDRPFKALNLTSYDYFSDQILQAEFGLDEHTLNEFLKAAGDYLDIVDADFSFRLNICQNLQSTSKE